jgi:hypothetical protein
VWYANQRLNGDGSCSEITKLSNQYTFVRNADFKFIDVYMWNNAWNSPWHYGAQDSYWSRKGSPSVYRIFSPRTKKVTGIDYNAGPIEPQIRAAIAENTTVDVSDERGSGMAERRAQFAPTVTGESLTARVLAGTHAACLQVFDSRGRIVASQDAPGGVSSISLDISALPRGAYVAVLSTGTAHDVSTAFARR